MANVAVVNSIKVAVASMLSDQGSLPPVITGSQLVGAHAGSDLFDAAYADHARRLAQILVGMDPNG
jgi:hypothetical protein